MGQIPLAVCDNSDPRRRHVLARLVAEDGRAKVSLSVGSPGRTKSANTPLRRISVQRSTWATVDLDTIDTSDTDLGAFVFCRNCRRTYRLNFNTVLGAYRSGKKPPILSRISL